VAKNCDVFTIVIVWISVNMMQLQRLALSKTYRNQKG